MAGSFKTNCCGNMTTSVRSIFASSQQAEQIDASYEKGRTINSEWSMARLGMACLLVAAGAWAIRGAWSDILHLAWRDEESSHIWLVPFLAAWLVWVRRDELSKIAPRSSWLGPALVAGGSMMSRWAFTSVRHGPFQFSAVIILLGCVLSVLGPSVLRKAWPAVLVLVFLIPVPGMMREKIAIPLERATAAATTSVLHVSGFPVSRSGNQIQINKYPVTVAEGCNGLRMIFPLFLVVYVFCFTLPLRPWVRILLLITSPISAIICNVLRLIPTVLLYGYASKSSADTFHSLSGWPMVCIAFVALMGLIKLLQAMRIPVMNVAGAK
jgi:exosortase